MLLGAGVMGLADGPTEVHKVTVARQVLRDYRPSRRPLADRAPPEKVGRGPARSSPSSSSTRWATCDRHSTGSTAWMDEPGPRRRRASRSRPASSPAAPRTRSTRSAGATLHGALRIPPPHAPESRDEGILREWRIIEALDGTDVPHTPAIAACTDTRVLGRAFYVMGFVDGWSPMGLETSDGAGLAGAVRHRPRGPRRAWPTSWSRASPCSRKVDWQAKGLEDLGRPDGFHERQVDRWTAFLERIKGRELPGFDEAAAWLRAHQPIDFVPGLMHGDYQFANVMYEHGAPARLAAIVDWEMGTVGDPKLDLGWVVHGLARRPRRTGDGVSYVDMHGMPTRDQVLDALRR